MYTPDSDQHIDMYSPKIGWRKSRGWWIAKALAPAWSRQVYAKFLRSLLLRFLDLITSWAQKGRARGMVTVAQDGPREERAWQLIRPEVPTISNGNLSRGYFGIGLMQNSQKEFENRKIPISFAKQHVNVYDQ